MRRVCGFDTLSAHLVQKSLSLSLSVALGVLPMAPAFARDDDRYSYSANNRYHDFQNQYKPQKNYSLTSQLDRQIQTQNTALQFRFGQRIETKTPTFAFSQSNKPSLPQPQFQFGIQTRKAVEAYKLDIPRPEAAGRGRNSGMLGTIASAFKATFRAIGTAIGKVVGFFTVDRARVTAEVQRDRVLKENPGLRAVSPGVFQVPAGQTAQHVGRIWEAGSTFQMKADGRGIALTEGVTLSPDLGGIRRADGNPLPVKMMGENGGFKPIGIDFARVEPKTRFNFTSPVEMGGVGQIPAGASMTYEAMNPGTKEDPTPTVVLSFQNARIMNPQGALEALGKGKEPVTLGQMEMRLKGAINQISGLYVNRGGEKIYTSQYGEAFSVTQLEKKSAAARDASSALVQQSKKLTDDVTSATLHSKMLMGRLHEQTGTPATVDFQVKTPVTAQAQATKALVRKTEALARHMADGNYTQVANAITEVERAQGEQLKGIGEQQAQVEIFQQYKRAVKGLEQAYGQLAAQADPASMKAPGETKETLADAAPYFKKEKNDVQIQVGNALKALNAMEAQGIITPTENLLKATEIKVIRDHLLSAKPDVVGKAVIKTADAMEKNYQAVSQDVGEAVFDPMYKMAEKYPKTMQAVGQGALALAGGAAIVGLGYGMATAPATTAVVVGSGVVSQKTFEAMGLSPEAAAFYTAIVMAPAAAGAGESKLLRNADETIVANAKSASSQIVQEVRQGPKVFANEQGHVAMGDAMGKLADLAERVGLKKTANSIRDSLYADIMAELPKVRRAGLPERTRAESLLKGQLTDGEWDAMRQMAIELKKDIPLTGSRSETDLGLARRYAVKENPDLAKRFGIPEWRAAKPGSGLIDSAAGDVDIWEGAGLTEGEKITIMKKVFPNVTDRQIDSGYSLKYYPHESALGGESGPGALIFRSNGRVERILASWQRE
jgi:hypothetical protein